MAELRPRSGILDIRIDAGSHWTWSFLQRVKATGVAIPYPAGSTAYLTVRATYGAATPILQLGPALADLDGVITVDPPAGIITVAALPIELLAAALIALSDDTPGVHSLVIFPGADETLRYTRLKGIVRVDPEVFALADLEAP